MEYDLNSDGKLDQLDYSIAEVGFSLSSEKVQLWLYWITLTCLFGTYLLCQWIVKSRLGKVLLAIRDDEPTLHFFGYKPHVYKIFAFCIAAALAGLAGMLFVPQMKMLHHQTWRLIGPYSWWYGLRLEEEVHLVGQFSVL